MRYWAIGGGVVAVVVVAVYALRRPRVRMAPPVETIAREFSEPRIASTELHSERIVRRQRPEEPGMDPPEPEPEPRVTMTPSPTAIEEAMGGVRGGA